MFSDTASDDFGLEATLAELCAVGGCHVEDSVGILKHTPAGENVGVWVAIEKVDREEMGLWMKEKHEGAGRDRRILSAQPTADTPLSFKAAFSASSKDRARRYKADKKAATTDPIELLMTTSVATTAIRGRVDRQCFQGTSAFQELAKSNVGSNREPGDFILDLLDSHGVSRTSPLGFSLVYDMHTLFLLMCIDGVDAAELNAAEHIARRVVQAMKAIRRNPRMPDFSGLGNYMRHCDASGGFAFTPDFDSWIAELNKAEGFYLKHARLARDEEEAEHKHSGSAGADASDLGPRTARAKKK